MRINDHGFCTCLTISIEYTIPVSYYDESFQPFLPYPNTNVYCGKVNVMHLGKFVTCGEVCPHFRGNVCKRLLCIRNTALCAEVVPYLAIQVSLSLLLLAYQTRDKSPGPRDFSGQLYCYNSIHVVLHTLGIHLGSSSLLFIADVHVPNHRALGIFACYKSVQLKQAPPDRFAAVFSL